MNYSNTKNRAIRRGRMSDVIVPKKRLWSTRSVTDKREQINEMKFDLVRVLADLGIVLSSTHSIAQKLIDMGWLKTSKIKGTS